MGTPDDPRKIDDPLADVVQPERVGEQRLGKGSKTQATDKVRYEKKNQCWFCLVSFSSCCHRREASYALQEHPPDRYATHPRADQRDPPSDVAILFLVGNRDQGHGQGEHDWRDGTMVSVAGGSAKRRATGKRAY